MEKPNMHMTQRESEQKIYNQIISILGKEQADLLVFR